MRILLSAPINWIHSKRALSGLLQNDIHVILLDFENPFPQGKDGFKYVRFPRTPTRYLSPLLGKQLSMKLAEFLVRIQLMLINSYYRPDVTHVFWVGERAHYLLKAGFKPLIVTALGSDINECFLPGLAQSKSELIGEVLAGSDMITIDSSDLADKCETLAGRKIRTELLALGVNTSLFCPGYESERLEWKRKLRIPRDASVLFSARALEQKYNHLIIVNAFAKAIPFLRRGAVMILKRYNGDTEYEKELSSLIVQLGIADSIRWIDEVSYEQMPGLYALADIIINFPSYDAFPVTFFEAAACERYVITCGLPSYSGTFVDKYFRIIEPGNVTELSDAIVDSLNNSLPWKEDVLLLLKEARKEMQADHDEANCLTRLKRIYEELSLKGQSVA